MHGFPTSPARMSYDVIIIGGAMMGAATAWFLAANPDFTGSVLVIERDMRFTNASTSHTNSCIRQQFSTPLNIRISQFAARFIQTLPDHIPHPDVPRLTIRNFGYLYLAGDAAATGRLRAAQKTQAAEGAGTRLLSPDEIAEAFPFYDLTGIHLGSHNTQDEGYWDGNTLFGWWRRDAKARGVESIEAEVTALTRGAGNRVQSVTLADGTRIACGHVVNAAGPGAAHIARMVGAGLPVEPRKRFTWVFEAAHPLDRPLPLTIDPSGFHVRQDGARSYMAGGHAAPDGPAAADDFSMLPDIWESAAWPAIAARIPAFAEIRVTHAWAGHYAYNTLDQNAVLGPHPEVENFHFINGFSGHGLQQSPAMGRGLAEMLTYGAYRSLDLSPFSYARITEGRPYVESAVI